MEQMAHTKYLGLIIACHLNWKKYADKVSKKISRYWHFFKTFSLLTERKGRTGEYRPSLGPYCRHLEDQYPPLQPEQARLVSCLLYGTLAFGDACFSFCIKSFQIFRVILLHLFVSVKSQLSRNSYSSG